MQIPYLAVISEQDVFYFSMFLLLVLFGLTISFIFNWWMSRESSCPSPYTGLPMRKGSDIHWMTAGKVLRFLYDMHDYDNRLFDLNKAAICRETGRIFSDALTWYGTFTVDWDFIQKRYPGKFVSWGSLTEEQQVAIMDRHGSLEGFQTEKSSPSPSPRQVEPEYAKTKPGPLYVDVTTGVLLGWKQVPETELEVLIVQKPEEVYIPGIHKKYS